MTDVEGKTYIDMISQFAVVNFGHSHPHIVEAVVDQTRRSALVNTSYVNPLYGKLAQRMTKVCDNLPRALHFGDVPITGQC